ncbi:MAG: helix-turn-helix domain-containing protein, partial [Desulfomonile sp.]|nr:helix-turn-helix domain-containing protein [Desulfomonile sp.]
MAKTPTKTETMGERIAGMRKRQKVDIETLAKNTGYSVEYLQRIESGKVAPAVGALIRISRALAIDSASLLAESARKERR